jgi:hypothetical protein
MAQAPSKKPKMNAAQMQAAAKKGGKRVNMGDLMERC